VESSWGSEAENEAFQAVLEQLEAASGGEVHGFADILDEGTWADPERGTGVLSAAGFDVGVVTEPVRGRYADAPAALAWTLAWPDYRETAARLTKPAREAFESRALAAAAEANRDWWFAINYSSRPRALASHACQPGLEHRAAEASALLRIAHGERDVVDDDARPIPVVRHGAI
jgi:hypothetical protein